MEKLEINDSEIIEIQTHIKILNNAYGKFQQQRLVVQSLEDEFQSFFNSKVEEKGGSLEKQWQLDLENKFIVEAENVEQPPVMGNNGTQPDGQFSDAVEAEISPATPKAEIEV